MKGVNLKWRFLVVFSCLAVRMNKPFNSRSDRTWCELGADPALGSTRDLLRSLPAWPIRVCPPVLHASRHAALTGAEPQLLHLQLHGAAFWGTARAFPRQAELGLMAQLLPALAPALHGWDEAKVMFCAHILQGCRHTLGRIEYWQPSTPSRQRAKPDKEE